MKIVPQMSHEEWMAEGTRRFGDDVYNWKFVCPICGNVASIDDFKQYKDRGATPDSATQECIGRYNGSKFEAFPREGAKQGKPCNYALYGLFRLPGVIVTGSPYAPNGKDRMSFAFAEVETSNTEPIATQERIPHVLDERKDEV